MGFYEFACLECKVAFGLSIEGETDPSEFFCVECGATDLQLTAYDEELSLRIACLVESVNELTDRVKFIEDEICEPGPDTTSSASSAKNN